MQMSREERRRIQMARSARNRRESVFNCSNRAMKSDVTIQLDKSSYLSGDVITGCVSLTLTQDVKIKELSVRIHGHARVSWSEQRAYIKGSSPSVNRKNTETYLDHAIPLLRPDKIPLSLSINKRALALGMRPSPASSTAEVNTCSTSGADSDDGVFVPPGEHKFPFEYTLPHGLPSSFEGKWGHVKYSAKCVLERPWKFNIEREEEFKFKALTDLNEEPELVKPIGALGEFRAGMFCFNQGFVNVEIRLMRRGFIPGDAIPCKVEIENNTRHKLFGIRLTLQQNIVFRVGKKTRKITHTLAAITKGEVTSNDTALWENETLKIPADTQPSTNKNFKSISVKYTVTLHVAHSTWREEYTLPVVIIIGTEPFRKGFIHNYLTVCGYTVTPKGSPSNSPRTRRCMVKSNGHEEDRQVQNVGWKIPESSLHLTATS